MTNLIYKICPRALWQAAEAAGVFEGAPLDVQDGYVRLSTAEQVQKTAGKHFAGQHELLLIAVDADRLGEALRYDPSATANCFRISTHRYCSPRYAG